MSAEDNLSSLQFSFSDVIGHHRVRAHLGDKPIGTLEWAKGTGKIHEVLVMKPHRRKGIATALLAQAKQAAQEKGLKEPVHSERRSDDGQAWAASTGDPLPERKGDREL
jgi:GNAT superfamily N-acetyltransferase